MSGMRPVRLMQVDSYYSAYLRQFYGERPELRDAPYTRQTAAILDDGYAAIHRVGLHLDGLGYEVRHVAANAVSAQGRWAAENGVPIEVRSEADALNVLRRQIDAFQPDVLYTTDTMLLDGNFLRSLKRRPPLVMGWHASPIPPGLEWSGYDVILTALDRLRSVATERLGARAAEHFVPGFPTGILTGLPEPAPRQDVVFVGQYTQGQHRQRGLYLEAIAEAAAESRLTCAFHLSGGVASLPESLGPWARPPVYGRSMHMALRSGRMAFDARSEMTYVDPVLNQTIDLAGRQTANMRIFECTGGGSFLITERFDNLGDWFDEGREIETFGDPEELMDKIRFFAAHERARETIARAGQRRCLTEHSMERRAADFDAIIRKYLA